jgi:hypothetical protein
MAPGGEHNIDKLVEGLDLAGKRVLDIGRGLTSASIGPLTAPGIQRTFEPKNEARSRPSGLTPTSVVRLPIMVSD